MDNEIVLEPWNCATDMQETDATVSYNQVPYTLFVVTVMNGV